MSQILVGGRTVRRDGEAVAYLTYGGLRVTVKNPAGRVLGRLVRHPGVRPEVFDAWTALHEAAETPSDTILASGVPLADGVIAVLEHGEAAR